MTRYTTRRPRASYVENNQDGFYIYDEKPTLQELEGQFTGLLDPNGNEIWTEPEPIGFKLERFK